MIWDVYNAINLFVSSFYMNENSQMAEDFVHDWQRIIYVDLLCVCRDER